MEVDIGMLIEELKDSLDGMDDLGERLAAESELTAAVEHIRDLHLKYVP